MPGIKFTNGFSLNPKWIQSKFDNKSECLIQQYIQKEIDDGVPIERRTKVFSISCPCHSCSPYKF
jgi:hypothetical protein